MFSKLLILLVVMFSVNSFAYQVINDTGRQLRIVETTKFYGHTHIWIFYRDKLQCSALLLDSDRLIYVKGKPHCLILS